jgi:hypothetical protein
MTDAEWVQSTAEAIATNHPECAGLKPPCKPDCLCYFDARREILGDESAAGGQLAGEKANAT